MAEHKSYFKELEQKVLKYLDDATNIRLSLDSDQDAYHFEYVRKKITECGVAMEKLSDMQMELTKIALEVIKFSREARFLLKKEIAVYKSQPAFLELPGNARDAWLNAKTSERESEVETLNNLTQVVSEVRGVLSDRISTLKRLDSDIRLHQKMIEMLNIGGSGVAAPAAFAGTKEKDLEL